MANKCIPERQAQVWEKVYFLVERGTGDFKIGKSKPLEQRMFQLPQEFDPEPSRYINCHPGTSRGVEKAIQIAFEPYGFDHPRGGDGHTEWFRAACFKQVLEYVGTHRAFLRCSELKTVRGCYVAKELEPTIRVTPSRLRRIEREQKLADFIKEHDQLIKERLANLFCT